MPPKAEVLVVENNFGIQRVYARELPWGGHRVVAMITGIDEASAEIHALKQSGTMIDVAIVDGDLGNSHHGEDGAAVVKILREVYPETKIIGNAGSDEVRGADVNLPKDGMNIDALVDAVTAL